MFKLLGYNTYTIKIISVFILKNHHFLVKKIGKNILSCIKSWKTYNNLDKILINPIIIIVNPIKSICIYIIFI